jgi:nitric oxide dioxygenase
MLHGAEAANLLWDQLSGADHPRLRATLAPVLADPAAFGRRFYERLFEISPGLRALFPADLAVQQLKLAQMLCLVVASLDQTEKLEPTLQRLGESHRGFGAKPAHYVAVGEALLDTLAEINGVAFDDEARASWQRLYGWVAHRMRRG